MGQTNRAAMPENLSLLRLHLQSANQLPRICSLPKSIGWCSSSVRRFYYDTEIRMCLPFIYRGCLGNSNNFESIKECRRKCQQYGKRSWPEVCTLQRDPGSSSIPLFYFNINSKRCEIFYYGGCGGNANNFLTKNECISKFHASYPPKCKLRRKVGRCKGKLERYYFDMGRKRCQPFTYSGCGGNENRFVTRVDCLLSCENMGKKNNYDFSAIWVTNFVLFLPFHIIYTPF
uniref:Tissue factor pathway inhibitor n=1 Tax=Anolis carolinensis TaxID=28377 RepID=A0A803TGY1_ANOCA